ncbi:Uncharacterised protein [uncultured archaeon]|nr:Uncharacterised protein [uncultured archaeon]
MNKNNCNFPLNTMNIFTTLPQIYNKLHQIIKIMPLIISGFSPSCAPLSPTPTPLPSVRFHRRAPASSEPAPLLMKSAIRKRTRMTRIGWISTDFPIRANPRHPFNPCSTAVSPVVEAPGIRNVIYIKFARITNLRSSALICGSFFPEAFIHNTFSGLGTTLNMHRIKLSYAQGNACIKLMR